MRHHQLFDITIIGGGPAGLYSAFYSGLRNMKTKIIEHQKELGGKVHVYPEKIVWDVGGVPPVPGATLIDQMVEQGLTFQPEVALQTTVDSITREEDGNFLIHTSKGEIHYSKAIILAVGGGILSPNRLEIEGAEQFEGSHLHYSVASLKHFKNKTVFISGGGNSAIDWARELERVAKQVYIACRRDNFTCHENQAKELQQSSAVCLFNSKITGIIPADNQTAIGQVEITNLQTGQIKHLPVDDVLINHGYKRELALLDETPLAIEKRDDYFIAGNENSETSVPGIYAAGDALMHDGKLHLIAGAFQDAAHAVNLAKQWLEPHAEKGAMVSSHNDAFQEKNQAVKEELLQSF